jgi:hypothetical protein
MCFTAVNPLNAELNPICHLLAFLGAHHIPNVSRIRVKELPKGDQYRSNHVGVMTNFCKIKYNFSITAFVGFIV